jgi:hypothetical protein
MGRFDHRSFHLFGTCDGGIEVVEFKPQEHAISVWLEIGITQEPVLMRYIPSVQLKKQLSMRNEALVFWAAMPGLTAQETLVPATARFNIVHANKGLQSHNH